jgi:ribonuclease-3
MARGLPVPTYAVVASQGPSHAPRFTVQVSVAGVDAETAEGGSKRDAEKAAAEMMLIKQEGRL